jgi:hypothetical protein
MNVEEIRKNAPEGATHYKLYGLCVEYYIKIEEKWCYFKNSFDLYSTSLQDHEVISL